MIQIGDTVRFLNSTGGGVVRRIEGNIAYVDEDGFETPTLLRECVVVATAAAAPRTAPAAPAKAAATSSPAPAQAPAQTPALTVEETPGARNST